MIYRPQIKMEKQQKREIILGKFKNIRFLSLISNIPYEKDQQSAFKIEADNFKNFGSYT